MMKDGSWIKIKGLADILKIGKPLLIDPRDEHRYADFWSNMRYKLINGTWVEQFDRWRYVPGRILWFGNYCYYEEWDPETKQRVEGKPMVRDLEWHRFYYRLICDGFSGFKDSKYTSYKELTEPGFRIDRQPAYVKKAILRKDGRFKEYCPPMEALFELSDEPAGFPLYHNQALNFVEIGSRGGGKTYSKILGGFFYDLCMDGQRHYDLGKGVGTSKASLEITAGQEAKSAEALAKLEYAMKQLSIREELGSWGKPGDKYSNYTPMPFWKRMEGSIEANNRKDPWTNKYLLDVGISKPQWEERGSDSKVYHTVYPATEQGSGQKSAGGRRTHVLHEEIGLNARLLEAWGSNEGLISGDGTKYAPQEGIGTSGNLDLVQQARRLFETPKEFSCLELPHPEDPDKTCGLFLPAYITDMNFKDEDGNTDLEAAKEHHENLHKKIESQSQLDTYITYAMNYPIRISHMWMQDKSKLLPSVEAERREEELLKGDYYKYAGKTVELFFDPNTPNKIGYRPKPDALPFYDWPLSIDRKTLDAVFMMYIEPESLKVNGKIPDDAIIVIYDPYVADEWDKGGSLGVTHYIVSPKYIPDGLPGHKIAATYIGKHKEGLDEHNRIVLMGAMLYGRPKHGIWYEANRGSDLRSMAIHMNVMDMLCLQPQFAEGKFNYEQNTTRVGYMVGNQISKQWLITRLRYYLLSPSNSTGLFKSLVELEEEKSLVANNEKIAIEDVRLIIQSIDCIFTIRQIKAFNAEGNFDAVSSYLGLPLAIGEMAHRETRRIPNENRSLSLLSTHLKTIQERNRYGMAKLSSRSRRTEG